MIKVWDYLKEYDLLRDEILDAVDQVFKNGTLIFGPKLDEFEDKFSNYHECRFGIGVGNCTDAITIALKALDVGLGDEVITTSNTAVPTVTAIVNTGASVSGADIMAAQGIGLQNTNINGSPNTIPFEQQNQDQKQASGKKVGFGGPGDITFPG